MRAQDIVEHVPQSLGFSKERSAIDWRVCFLFSTFLPLLPNMCTKACLEAMLEKTAFERKQWLSVSCFVPAGVDTGQSTRLILDLALPVCTAWADKHVTSTKG